MAEAGNVVVVVKVTGLAEAFHTLAKAHRALAELSTTHAVLLEQAASQLEASEDHALDMPEPEPDGQG